MDDKELLAVKEQAIVILEAAEELYERFKELTEIINEQLKPLEEAVKTILTKALETDDEVLENIMLYSNPRKRELLKLILEYKKIYKRYEPP